jgi:hypothetical protein
LHSQTAIWQEFVKFVREKQKSDGSDDDLNTVLFWGECKDFESDHSPTTAQRIWVRYLATDARQSIRSEFFEQDLKAIEKALTVNVANKVPLPSNLYAASAQLVEFLLSNLFKKYRIEQQQKQQQQQQQKAPSSSTTTAAGAGADSTKNDFRASVAILQQIFPDMDEDMIEATLDAHDNDVTKTQRFFQSQGLYSISFYFFLFLSFSFFLSFFLSLFHSL